MITRINKSRMLTKYVLCKCNLIENLTDENVIQIKNGIKINVDANVKDKIYVKYVTFGILLHEVAKFY